MDLIIDPDLKYCPACEDEYRAEIEQCAVCGMKLLTGAEMLRMQETGSRRPEQLESISADDELVDLRRGSMVDIRNLQTRLENEGIPTVVAGEKSCGKGCCGGSELFLKIRVADLQDALQFLEKEHIRSTGLEDHDLTHADAVFNTAAQETICPACGCKFQPTTPNCPDCGLCFA